MIDQKLINKYIERIKIDYPEDDKLMIDLQQFSREVINEIEMEENFKLRPDTEIPERRNIDDVDYSHDVFIIDEDNCKGVAFYKHSENTWIFHTEHFFDELKFKWFYGPDVEN